MIYSVAILLSLLAGLSTFIGGLLIFFLKKTKFCYLCIAFGFSAGVMIFVSFAELLSQGIKATGFLYATFSFFFGILLIYLIDILIPHTYEEETYSKKGKLKKLAVLLILGITIHNFPEGITVFFSSLSNIKLGILIALAIAIHNIPEGVAVSMPIFYATKSKRKALKYSFLAGISEPIGAILSFIILYNFLNDFVLGLILSATAGVMIFISFDELLPYVYKHKNQHLAMLGLFLGMFIISISIFLLA
ncbi:MAG: zinc transporter ZupT [Candidatus Aenigmatarchaeota archaeon]